MKHTSTAIFILATSLLSGCLFPEKFDSKITINPDASYNVKFNGTVAHVPTVALAFKSGKATSPEDDAKLTIEAKKMEKSDGVKSASYLGNGRLKITTDNDRKAGIPINLMDMIRISTGKDGVMTISSVQLDDVSRQNINGLGLSINGTLEVVLPKNAIVVSSNVTTTPSFFGLVGFYGWKIGNIDQAPMLKIKFKN